MFLLRFLLLLLSCFLLFTIHAVFFEALADSAEALVGHAR